MTRKILLAVAGLFVAALPAMAQQSATVVTRSGERIGGELIDFNASGFILSVNGQTRSFGANDVASVEFQGRQLTADQQAKLNAGQRFLLLNDGQVIDGSIYDISGTSPLRITIDTSSGRRDFMSNDVAGLYLANPPGTPVATTGAAAQAAAAPAPEGAIVVPGNRQWTPTNIAVKQNQLIHFQTTGEVYFTANPADHAQANGSVDRKQVPGAPLPGALAGALIGRINNGPVFPIGQQTEMRMPATGFLFIGINDDNVADNGGQFNVIITK